jgi:hypothetical protein
VSRVSSRSSANCGSSAACSRRSVDLQAAIERFLAETNDNFKHWTADPDNIIAALRRGCQTFGF